MTFMCTHTPILARSKSEQEWLKIADNAVHKIRHTIQRFKNRLTSDNLRLAERYINSELEILVRFTAIGRVGQVYDVTAHLKRNSGPLSECNFLASSDHEIPLAVTCSEGYQNSMFVEPIQFVNVPQRVIPTETRLHLTQDFVSTREHLVYFSLTNGRCIFLRTIGIAANREISVFPWCSSSCFNKLPSKVVESTSEVVDSVSDNHREIWWDSLDALDIKRSVLNCGHWVWLGSDCVRLISRECLDSSIQLTDVLYGPFNFFADTVDTSHD